MTVKHK